jgi:hypothetical protein
VRACIAMARDSRPGTRIALNTSILDAASRKLHGEHAPDGTAADDQDRNFAGRVALVKIPLSSGRECREATGEGSFTS